MADNTINNDMTMSGATGTLLAGRYRVVRQLGQGGMGSVWLAEDTKLDGFKVAIKMLPSVLVNNKRAYQQVKAEALVSLKLSHPNIVTVRAFEEEGGSPFLVMDYIDGQTLDDYLAEKGKLTEEETVKLLKPVAAALDYAHTQGVVHRDIKPGNVMIRKDGTPFVLDFGIAREIQETMTRVTGKLSSGTLMYMSPEQLNGRPPKAAQDVYSFAAMAYECLKGEPPFCRGQVEHQILECRPEPLPGEVSVGAAVLQGLEKEPANRSATCAEVLLPHGCPRPVEPVEPSPKRSGFLSALICIFVSAVAVLGWKYYRLVQASQEEQETPPVLPLPVSKPAPPDPVPVYLTNTVVYVRTNDVVKTLVLTNYVAAPVSAPPKDDNPDMVRLTQGQRPEDHKAVDEPPRRQSNGEEAPRVIQEARSQAAPTLTLRATVDGNPVAGARIVDGAFALNETLPWTSAELEKGATLDSFVVEYVLGKRKWRGSFKEIPVDWFGPKTLRCPLKEIKEHDPGEEMTIMLPGGEEMTFCWCPPGSFMMGSPEYEQDHKSDERQHRVTLTKGFWMGKYEVTQRQWESVMGINPSNFKGWFKLSGNHPAESMSWNDCQEFIRKINASGQVAVSLPTEAQWEYACRAGTKTPFNFGSVLKGDNANCIGDKPYGTTEKGPNKKETASVGSYAPNAWGLYDMHGNVCEWCQDMYDPLFYGCATMEDPFCAGAAVNSRVKRGGGCGSDAKDCRSASRDHSSYGSIYCGLRLVCSTEPRKREREVFAVSRHY